MQSLGQTVRGKTRLYLDLIRFDRPAGWLLLLWPTWIALWLAADGWPGWHLFLVFGVGTVLMRSAGCCVNDVADADVDRHVKRTANRPVTSGQISQKEALLVGAALALMAFLGVLTTRPALVWWSLIALSITVLYPFAKRRVAMPQAVLGVAFGVGIPMAFTAVHALRHWPDAAAAWASLDAWAVSAMGQGLTWQVWVLMLGNLCWVLAYDTEYAMVDRDDDLKLGIYTSAITLGRFDVAAVMGFYGLHVALWAWALWGVLPLWLLGLCVACVLAQVVWHWGLIRHRTREGCFKAFKLNHWIGWTWFAAVVVGLGV